MAATAAGVAGIGGAICLNLHYPIFGGSIIEGVFSSRLTSFANRLWCSSTRKKMTKEGIPEPSETIEFAPGEFMDLFDFRDSKQSLAPAVLYFHAGSFCMGGREFGAGTLSWLAKQGCVCFSVGYRLTSARNSPGVVGCISSAWSAFRYVKANAHQFGLDCSKVVVMGDSAGGALALSLASGLQGGEGGNHAPVSERPVAAITGWGVCTLGSKTFSPIRNDDGSWGQMPAAVKFECKNRFLPENRGKTAAETQRQCQKVLGGLFLVLGRRSGGWLPASAASFWPEDDCMSISPLSRATEPGLSPTLMLIGDGDQVVPANQQLMFAEVARSVGNHVAAVVFEGADHGVGGLNSAAGRAIAKQFLESRGIQLKAADGNEDPAEHVQSAVRVFGLDGQQNWADYRVEALDKSATGWMPGSETIRVPKASAAKP